MPKIAATGVAKTTPAHAPAKAAAPKTKAPGSVKDVFDIGSIRDARGVKSAKAVAATDGIQTALDIDALGDITTHGRHGTGFMLDGDSVRGQWVSARRIVEDGKKGYEMFFFAEGAARETFKARLEKLHAETSDYAFAGAKLAGSDGKSALHRNEESWSPSSSSALMLTEKGKWSVELVSGEPEALRGAMRIKVFGTDTQASKALGEAVQKVGLHEVFAPSTKDATAKLKISRFLWQNAQDAVKTLTSKSIDEIPTSAILAAIGPDHAADIAAVKKADLKDEATVKRAKLAALFIDKDPAAFVEWASNASYTEHGILPQKNGYDYAYIESSMSSAGIEEESAAFKKALTKAAPPREAADKALLFGLLAHTDKEAALALLKKDAGQIKAGDLEDIAIGEGFTAARLKQLKFQEVYPGYFTVIDPAAVAELHKAGARYLYSTYDSADRVMSMLTGGQKSSLTRFGEGLLVQGMSTASDFGTGGAGAVFTRLVTKSAIAEAKKADHDSWSSDGKFNDWSGARPYKVILNQSILARTDWWGFNGDNYGKSTGLKAENFGAELVKAIDKAYDDSNELMFPVGNDPAYADFVVCATAEQKKELIEKMKKAGMKDYNGKPLTQFVRVETHLFDY